MAKGFQIGLMPSIFRTAELSIDKLRPLGLSAVLAPSSVHDVSPLGRQLYRLSTTNGGRRLLLRALTQLRLSKFRPAMKQYRSAIVSHMLRINSIARFSALSLIQPRQPSHDRLRVLVILCPTKTYNRYCPPKAQSPESGYRCNSHSRLRRESTAR